jgi:drug/metabolite transporter (DMT)-like permease
LRLLTNGYWQTTFGIRLWIITVAASWGTAFAFIKIIRAAGFGPFSVAAGRSSVTAILFSLFLLAIRHSFSKDGKSLRHMAFLGVFNGLLPNILIALAMQDLATAPAGLIQASVPIIVALCAHFMFQQERLDIVQTIGVLIGFAGVIFVIGPAEIMAGRASLTGSLSMLGAAGCYAASTLYLRSQKPDDALSVTLGAQIVSAIGAWMLLTIFESHHALHFDGTVVASFLGLALIATLLPSLLYFHLVKQVEASRASLVQYLLPLFTAIYGVWLLREPLQANVLWGGLAILAGMSLATRMKVKKAHDR